MSRIPVIGLFFLATAAWPAAAASPTDWKASVPGHVPDGWAAAAPRQEICPAFTYEPMGGADGKAAFVITAGQREGLDGCWTKTFSCHRWQTLLLPGPLPGKECGRAAPQCCRQAALA